MEVWVYVKTKLLPQQLHIIQVDQCLLPIPSNARQNGVVPSKMFEVMAPERYEAVLHNLVVWKHLQYLTRVRLIG